MASAKKTKPIPASADADAASAEFAGLPSGDRVYRILIRMIERGELKGGTRLREAELGTRLGVSRTPVREALARLEEQGLLVNEGSRGIVVAELDHRAITELYAMREVLEGTAARLASRHASEVEVTILRKIVERNAQLTDEHDLAENNKLFHGTLYRCSHNRYLLKMLRSLHEAMLLVGQPSLVKPSSAERWTRELAERLARSQIAAAFSDKLTMVIANMGSSEDG